MAQAVQVRLDSHMDVGHRPASDLKRTLSASAEPSGILLTLYDDLSAIEQDWRAFEQHADCTVFQTFDWLAAWQRFVGAPSGVRPVILVARDFAGSIFCIFPLSVRSNGIARELTWLGSELCDYNGPLLVAGFFDRFDATHFKALWQDMIRSVQIRPHLHFDFIRLVKMPAKVGTQPNPLLHLRLTTNPSGAYLTHLTGDWEAFYAEKRSSATRQRDRSKRRRLSNSGEVQLVTVHDPDDILNTLDTLMAQKARSFARMGIANLFARPGFAEFYRALATEPATRHLTHVSRLKVGNATAAANLALTFRGRYYHLLLSHDDGELSRFGPGAAHLHELLRHAIEQGFGIFDFTIGDERYKRDWYDTELTLYDHMSVATLRGALIAAPTFAALRLKRWIKQTPVLWSAFQKVRALIGVLNK